MKKLSKPISKRKYCKKTDNLFTKDNISLNNPKNKKYLDEYAYQKYLKKINNESCDFNEE